MPSIPDVTTTSPGRHVGNFRHVVQSQPVVAAADHDALRARALDDRPGRRVAIDQQLHLRRPRARHDDAGRPRRPGAITAMSARTPSRVPLSIVSVRKSGVAAAPMISAATVVQLEMLAQLQQLLQAAGAIGERALLLHRDLRARRARASAHRFRP